MTPLKFLMYNFILCCLLLPLNLRSQSQEVTQLLLNLEKLAQLAQMKSGYQSIENGYTRVQDIDKRTYILHRNFLDALLQVSPEVRTYQGIADCLTKQKDLVQIYHSPKDNLSSSALFEKGEREYVQNYATKILQNSLPNMDDLITILSPNKYRMSDAERLTAIDRSHKTVYNNSWHRTFIG